VLYTLHAILDPKNSVRSHEGYDLVDSATAPSGSTVVFHLKHAWAPAVMSYFSYGTTPQFVLPAHVLRKQEPLDRAAFNAAPAVGDGPYTFVAWQHGDRLRYAANPVYWRGKAKVATLDVRIAPDPSTNLVMLQSGSLDWNLIAPVQYQLLAGKPGLQFATTPTAVVAGIVFNTQHPALNDVNVRRAIAMAIDRDAISKKITLGKYPVTNMMQPQFSWAYDASIKQPGFNPKAAEAILRPRHLHLTYVQFPESITGTHVATEIQAEMKDVGVDLTIKSVSNQQLFLPKTGQLAAGAFDMAYVPFTLGGDPDDSFVLSCAGAQNYMRWCNGEVDTLEAQALSTNGQTQRKMIYGKIARVVADQVPLLYLFNADYIYAYRSRVHGFAPNAFLPTWNAGAWSV
jgi:peptide/nickel transport system substrate-binding protein